jgi:V8-like Glu-specific endopeptidase
MSHNIGRIITITSIGIGPDHATSSLNYAHTPEPGQPTRFLVLHFMNASFPANNRLEVNLGYGTDVFDASSGTEFWTRPINIAALSGGNVPINYIQNGASTGGVQLVSFGRAHPMNEGYRPCTFTNCDIFLQSNPYSEPTYDTFWICGANATTCASDPKWKNFNALPNDIRKTVGQASCMIVSSHGDHLSTCSATLIADDLVFSAGHCMSVDPGPSPLDPFSVLSASIVFLYQTEANGSKPSGYAPKIFKVIEVVEYGYDSGNDYIIMRIDISNGNTGITPLSMRTDLPAVSEQVFVVHHPNGAVKKFSPRDTDYLTVAIVNSGRISVNLDVAGGSSGSGLYDAFGNVIGTLSNGGRRDNLGNCSNFPGYYPTATMLKLIGTTPPAPSVNRDVMVVLDRSGSMSQTTYSGRQKIEEARDAASLFISMVEKGGGHRIGLVSFATNPNLDQTLKPNNNANVTSLIGPAPYSGGIVGGLNPSGSTTIGGGLDFALEEFSGSAVKDEVILLLTDGMENTPPMIEDVESGIGSRRLCIVGYGDESNLDGPTLARLAIMHDGSYTVAQDELTLKKYFASCFGDIFEAGFLMDPDFQLPRNVVEAKPMPFYVCGEETVTIVVGWDKPEGSLTFNMTTPGGNTVALNSANLVTDRGKTWVFVRIRLPLNGEQDGEWQVNVFRPPSSGEFNPVPVALKYFVNVIAKGGPSMKLLSKRKQYYTGEKYNPLVRLYYSNNISPSHAFIKLEVKRPMQSLGNLVKANGLVQTSQVAGDTIPSVYSTLTKIKNESSGSIVDYETLTFDLFDDGGHEDGAMESDGIFGNPLPDLLNSQGVYTFRAISTYGHDCKASRELVWSVYVDVKVDDSNSDIRVVDNGTNDNGRHDWTIILFPKDKYGNFLGPGRLDVLDISGTTGTVPSGGVIDNGDGSYSIDVTTDADNNEGPGIVVNQPGSAPGIFCRPCIKGGNSKGQSWLYLLLLILLLLLVILWMLLN